MPKFIDLTGERFGRWSVIARAENNRHNQPQWHCLCSCGKEGVITGGALAAGTSKSCGCLNKDVHRAMCISRNTTHGLSNSPEYNVWVNMRQRCENEKSTPYRKYGAKGISVCARWESFEDFLADMGKRPSPKHTIDRIDSSGNYEPKNCRWATQKQQQNNRNNNRLLTIKGRTQTAAQWADELGIRYKTFHARLQK